MDNKSVVKEKVLTNKKHGMAVLVITILLYVAAIGCMIYGGTNNIIPLIAAGGVYCAIGWIALPGLKVLKPQEALVLTLFGKYVGTIKNEGFYFVNPFCTAVNPAAQTKLSQSGDVDVKNTKPIVVGGAAASGVEFVNKKISLKIMTLSNNKQKINDCLGNPVEIGIAVMWRVVDTASAVLT